MSAKKKFANFREFSYQFVQNRAALAGLCAVSSLILISILAPLLTHFTPFQLAAGPFQPPNLSHYMGTDNMGRDIFSGIIYGARTSIAVGVLATMTSVSIGIFLGALSGFYGGKIDHFIMRTTDTFMIIPAFFLAVLVVAFFGATIVNVILVIGVLSWPPIARLIRAEFMKWKHMLFVDAARILGAKNMNLIFEQILPNTIAPAVVLGTLQVGHAILIEASLSFVGLGDPNVMSWGYMLRNAQTYIGHGWWMPVFPGLAVLCTVLAVNLVGDGINDAINPRLRQQ